MSQPEHELVPLAQHDRSEFQLERLILFTDAVFAIAITLLVIEIKVPELHHVRSEAEVIYQVSNLTPHFIGFFVAFFVIAIYWVAHHRIFRFVQRYNGGLIWLNVLFLLSIALMPFTSAFQSEYPLLKTPWILYCLSVIFTGLMQVWLQRYLRNPRHHLIAPSAAAHPDLDIVRPLISVSVFSFSIGVTLLGFPWLARFALLLFVPLMLLYGRRYRRLEREVVGG